MAKDKTQKGVYMDNKVWEVIEKRAKRTDRSINYIIEKALISYFNIPQN